MNTVQKYFNSPTHEWDNALEQKLSYAAMPPNNNELKFDFVG